MSARLRLSAVIITRNEGELLADCLNSVRWADEIILLDYNSSDDTVQIARHYGARVYHSHQWPGYGLQRQHAQRYASGEMIFMIDADERVTPQLQAAIEAVLRTPRPKTVYSISRRNLFLGRFMRHSGWYPDRVTRLYPRDYHYTDQAVHESLDTRDAQIVPLQGDLLHLTCRDFITFQRKQLSYAQAWAEQRHQRGDRCGMMAIFSHAAGAFFKTLLLRAGFLDGKQGWLLAIINAHYTFNKYAALWALGQTAKSKGRV